MRLKYVGPNTEGVEIPELERVGDNAVKHGEIIDVEDDIGKRLAATDDWQVTSRGGSSKKEGDE